MTLSGLKTDNADVAFGVKVQKGGTVVVVKTADAGFPEVLLNRPLSPNNTPIDDFYFLRV